ncbi:MAG: hypothetical protein GWO20_14320 [Candidatus Korarchaeota archaeon]|nr:hypothetical protein [Candidatus Korarchaeota archaeon]
MIGVRTGLLEFCMHVFKTLSKLGDEKLRSSEDSFIFTSQAGIRISKRSKNYIHHPGDLPINVTKMTNYFPLVSSVISAVFTLLLAYQYSRRKKKHQIIWTIALSIWFITTLLEFLGNPEVVGWNEPLYKVFYVLTPPMVALLGVGTLYLLTHRPWGKYFLLYTIGLSIPLFILGLTAPVQSDYFALGSEIAGEAMPRHVRILSPLMTIPGGVALIFGAIYSFWLDRSRKYNLLIALGGFFPFFGGMRARLGDPTFFYAFETLGALFLFTGFILSMEYIRKRETKT